MTPSELAAARHRLYAVLGELIAEGPTPDAVAIARVLPEISLDPDPDSLRSGHHHAIAASMPWESAWCAPDGQLGGDTAAAVRAAYAAGGFHPSLRLEADHLGLELAFLAHLSAAEVDALEDRVDPEPIRALQRGFVDQHVGRWLPAFAVAVADAGEPGWAAVASLAVEVVADHAPVGPWTPAGCLPALDAPDTGLGAITRALATPACSGWTPTAGTFARVGHRAAVPTGFGDRAGRLRATFEAASSTGRLGAVGEALERELVAGRDRLDGTPWAEAADATRRWLAAVTRPSDRVG